MRRVGKEEGMNKVAKPILLSAWEEEASLSSVCVIPTPVKKERMKLFSWWCGSGGFGENVNIL